MSHVCRDVREVPLPLLLITQAEIVAEHRLERFALALFKITDARRADQSESGPNFFHVRALSPDRQGEHLHHYFPQGFVTIVGLTALISCPNVERLLSR